MMVKLLQEENDEIEIVPIVLLRKEGNKFLTLMLSKLIFEYISQINSGYIYCVSYSLQDHFIKNV